MTPKPPIGLAPRFVRDERRRVEIQAAIMRYMDAAYALPAEWVAEYNEIVSRQKEA